MMRASVCACPGSLPETPLTVAMREKARNFHAAESRMSESAQPFHLEVAEVELQELRRRLSQTRWPEKEPVADWSQGVPLASLQALCEYSRTRYDWRRCERLLNGLGQHRNRIQRLGI